LSGLFGLSGLSGWESRGQRDFQGREGQTEKTLERELNRALAAKKFRFQDLRIWQLSIEIADELFDIADALEEKRLFRFAEPLRAAGMSLSNNIAEGSGSSSQKEFVQFLDVARRSTSENAKILILLQRRGLLDEQSMEKLLDRLNALCRQVTSFQKTLKH
jgi:four helix bundle protein